MLQYDPTEELTYFLSCNKRKSYHFGDIGLGVFKLLDVLKAAGMVVQYDEETSKIKLVTKDECFKCGIEYEHKVIFGHNRK